ncbi:MAG: hypothetical protein ACI4TX_03495, partial [Christensenellales bacterium]
VNKMECWGSTTENNLTADVVNEAKNLMDSIKSRNSKATFRIYTTDFCSIAGLKAAYDANLKDEDFKLILIEDGAGTYGQFESAFVTGKTVTSETDEPFVAFEENVQAVNNIITEIKAGTYTYTGRENYNYVYPFAVSTLSNVEFWIQTPSKLTTMMNANANIADSQIYSVVNGTNETYKMNIVDKLTANFYKTLNDEQQSAYKDLILGSYKTVVDGMFNRTNGVSAKPKLVIAGTALASCTCFGLVEDYTADTLPEGYNAQYINAVNIYEEFKALIYTLYNAYGTTYDILYKDHPMYGFEDGRLDVDGNRWVQTSRATALGLPADATVEEMKYLYTLINKFFKEDEIGKTFGLLPSSNPIDNYIYIGYNFKICGWDSSFYANVNKEQVLFFISSNGALGNSQALYNSGFFDDALGNSPEIYDATEIKDLYERLVVNAK